MSRSFSICLFTVLLLGLSAAWPPAPPSPPPRVGVDIPGADFPHMPFTLPRANYTLCADKCAETTGCRAWAYAIPGCDSFKDPMCWLKFVDPHNEGSNRCRVSGLVTTRPCQQETRWTSTVDPANPLPEYPRPQLTRGATSWKNLNGIWQFQPASQGDKPPFGKTLDSQILVPFPVESCLSGVGWNHQYVWYRLVFDLPGGMNLPRYLLNFGAVDWQTTVYVNQKSFGTHTGGYDPFTFDITSAVQKEKNELLVFVYDPSNYGKQPFGKQRVSAMTQPGGDTYYPVTGIWQTVWLENVATDYIRDLKITPSLSDVTVNVTGTRAGQPVQLTVTAPGNKVVARASGTTGSVIRIPIPSSDITLWTPNQPFLYSLDVQLSSSDSVGSYFGLRTFTLGKDGEGVTRPLLNGKFEFLAGWLDQSWWPDGLYTAPTDEALKFDLQAVKDFGFNFVRLHQKVNPQRWYYYADVLGIVVQQDAVQHYGDSVSTPDPNFYFSDLKAMIDNVYNHPCVVQWTAFNEGDMVGHFNPPAVVSWIQSYDPSRLVDTDSGGPANNLHVGDVNDVHTYPDPGNPKPSNKQYAEIGEYGGLGAFVGGHMWVEGACQSYKTVRSPDEFADEYITMTNTIYSNRRDVSVVVYTQITDVELECDGFYNFDRTNKLSDATLKKVVAANQRLING